MRPRERASDPVVAMKDYSIEEYPVFLFFSFFLFVPQKFNSIITVRKWLSRKTAAPTSTEALKHHWSDRKHEDMQGQIVSTFIYLANFKKDLLATLYFLCVDIMFIV